MSLKKGDKMEIIKLKINDITPYEKNAKIHTEAQIEQIKKSIQEFGMNDPIGYGVFQFRVSELMTVFPVHFKKARIGLLLGVAIANAMSPLGFIDVFCGTLTAGLLYYLIDRLPVHNYIKYILYSLEVGLIIGWELQLVYHMPFALTFFTTFIPEMILCIIGDLLAKKLKHYVNID